MREFAHKVMSNPWKSLGTVLLATAFPAETIIAGAIMAGTLVKSGYDSNQNKKAYENMMQYTAASNQHKASLQQQPPTSLQHNQSMTPSSSPKLYNKGKNQQKGI